MKISDKIKLDPNIMPFAFFFSKSVSIPSDINSSPKISLPGPALSLPGTCIITSKDLHYCFWGPALLLPRTCIIASRPAFSLSGPALSLPGPALLLPDLHYFTVTFPSRKIKQEIDLHTWEKFVFVCKAIFRNEKCPQIHIVPNTLKKDLNFNFSNILEIFEQK